MEPFKDKSGNRFTNKDAQRRSDARLSAKMPTQQAPADDDSDMGSDDVHSVVDTHGPASEVHVMHQEGKHSLHSVHPDGHTHQSEHGSAGEAHDAGKCLSGDCDCGGM